MASILNADTSNGLKLTSDTSGEIKLQSAGTDIVSVTANGMAVDTNTLYVDSTNNRVGIGTSSPATDLVVNTTGVQGLQLTDTSTNSSPRLLFTNDTNTWGVYNNVEDLSFRSGATIGSSSGTERMRINSSGRVGINITNPTAVLHIKGNNNPTSYFQVDSNGNQGIIWKNATNNTVGSVTVNASSTTYATTSDYRLKDNVSPMSGSIDRLKQLKPSTWSWKADGSHAEGFLAHEAQTVVPEAVTGTKDAMRTEEYEVTPAVLDDDGNVVTEAVMGTREVPDYQGIDQAKLVPLLTAALQEAITKIEDLETRIQALENA